MNETPDDPGNGEDNSEFEDEIATLATLISQARELVADGNTIDLTGLSEKVSVFCAHVSANPPSDTEGVMAIIEALVDDLNELGKEIAEQEQAAGLQPDKKGNGS